MRKLFVLFFIITLDHSAARAVEARDPRLAVAEVARNRGNFTSALALYQELADQGNAEGLYGLGLMISNGHGVPANEADGFQYIAKSADLGYPDAMAAVASARLNRSPVAQGITDPEALLASAASQGSLLAQIELCGRYVLGPDWGLAFNYVEAARWCRRAAQRGEQSSQRRLGVLYEEGKGVDASAEEAARWYLRAARQGEPIAASRLAELQSRGEGINRDPMNAYIWAHVAVTFGGDQYLELEKRMLAAIPLGFESQAVRAANGWKPSPEQQTADRIP